MNFVENLMKEMDQIEYGFKNQNGINIFEAEKLENEFSAVYYLMSPDELLLKKCGVCWDQVELERKVFDDHDIKSDTYFIFIDDKQYLPSHTFLVYNHNNLYYWFEHSWYDCKGIHDYKDINSLLNDVKNKFIESRKSELNGKYKLYIYKYEKPKYNINCDEFYNYIYTQKLILEDEFII